MTILGAILFASILFTSCGGGKSDLSFKLKTTAIKGELSDYFTIVDRAYKVEKPEGYDHYLMKVEFKRTVKEYAFDVKDLQNRGYCSIYLDLYDESGTPIIVGDLNNGFTVFTPELLNVKPGETYFVEYSLTSDISELKKGKTFEFRSVVDKDKLMSTSSDAPSSSIDCDKFIKDYEAFAESYVKLLKKYKANPTDATILTEYTVSATKAAALQTDASSCTDPKYSAKLLEIANKIAKAAI